MEIELRDEKPNDLAAIHALNELAFGQEQEANIVDALRQNGAARLSLVATVGGQVVGHIKLSSDGYWAVHDVARLLATSCTAQ